MKTYNRWLLCASLLAAITTQAAPVDPSKAMEEAEQFRKETVRRQAKGTEGQPVKLTLAYTSTSAEGTCYYIFNDNKGGFTIVSADDRLPAVLGYSDNGNFNPDRIPDNFRWWLSQYDGEISGFLKADPELGDAASRVSRRAKEADRASIAPLLKTKWDQTSPYNDFCPVGETGQPSVTGCVATAMAQIMKYHEWPVHPKGTNDGYMFTGTTLDWANMIDEYVAGKYTNAQAEAVALLMRQCGAAVNMMYSNYASGAYSFDVPNAMSTFFDYNKSMTMHWRDFYTQRNWNQLVYDELAAGRPVYYSGQSSQGGHAFVCDGYQGNDMFHFNWGWSGYQDGYFRLNALNPSAGGTGSYAGGYNSDQSIITGMKKYEGETKCQQALVSTGAIEYNSANGYFEVTGAGQNLIYNPLPYALEFNLGLRIANVNNLEESQYVKATQKTTLQGLYGFTEASFSIPTLADGEYRVYMAFFNCYDEWQDVLVPYGKQNFVTLRVAGGKQTLLNEGPSAETRSNILSPEADFVSPIYAGDGLAFRFNLINVDNGDFYGDLNVCVVGDDEWGDATYMYSTASVSGQSSSVMEVSTPSYVTAGKYKVDGVDERLDYVWPTFTVDILERPENLKAPEMLKSKLQLEAMDPLFQKLGGEMGISLSMKNSSSEPISTPLVIRLYKASDMSIVKELKSETIEFEADKTTSLNFEPRKLDIVAGNYYWSVQNEEGKAFGPLMPVMFTGPELRQGHGIFEVTDEEAKTARMTGLVDEEHPLMEVPDKVGDYTVASIASDVFTFDESVETVDLPGTIRIIPTGLFYRAANLKSVSMRGENPPVLHEDAFDPAKISEILVSGPYGYTNLYVADPSWAPFKYSSWEINADSGIKITGLLESPQGGIYSPYYYEASEWLIINVETAADKWVEATYTVGGETNTKYSASKLDFPPLRGSSGSINLKLVDRTVGVKALGEENARHDVYTPQGIVVLRNADNEMIRMLPKGIYIINGKKIVK
ncbi:MAG: C10 family peptidase [Muribaculum sp.]|nr:C10 family peptidase [Muribaculum sp.]